MRETIALLSGFALLSIGGRVLYRLYLKVCGRLMRADSSFPQDPGPVALVLTGFSLITMFILMGMAYMVIITQMPLRIGSVLLAGVLILVLDNILVYVGYRLNRQKNRHSFSDQLAFQRQQAQMDYYRALEEQYDRQRVLIHDIRKHLETVRDLAGEGLDEAIIGYVEELEASPALQNKVRICGNPVLDVILRRYMEICQAKGIQFLVDVRNQSVDFLESGDMTALFGNLLENAVEAAEGEAEGYVELMVDARPGGASAITLVNTCRELPESNGRGGFRTRKDDRDRHGIGLKSIRDTVKKYEGTMRQYVEVEKKLFHTVIFLK